MSCHGIHRSDFAKLDVNVKSSDVLDIGNVPVLSKISTKCHRFTTLMSPTLFVLRCGQQVYRNSCLSACLSIYVTFIGAISPRVSIYTSWYLQKKKSPCEMQHRITFAMSPVIFQGHKGYGKSEAFHDWGFRAIYGGHIKRMFRNLSRWSMLTHFESE